MAPQIEIPRVPETADEGDVLREQLDYLIGHAHGAAPCGCRECQRYYRVREILLEIFQEPQRAKVEVMPAPLARAA